MPSPLRLFLAILALGAYAQILQAVLIREALVVFYGNEISLGAFYASWLCWIGAGSLLALRWNQRPRPAAPARAGGPSSLGEGPDTATWPDPDPLPRVRVLLLALPLSLALQILALRTVRLGLDISAGELVPLGELFLALFLVTAPSGLILGLTFPLACRALERAATCPAAGLVSRLYIADALGALAGGALFTLVLIRWFGVVQSLAVLTALIGLTLWSLRAQPRRPGLGAPLLTLAGLTLFLLAAIAPLEMALERLRFATLQPSLTLVEATGTRYGHLAVARLGDQFSLIEDGQITESFPQPRERAADAAFLHAQAEGPARVLVLGGFAGGLTAELLRYPVARLDQVEQDPAAFARVAPHLPAASRAALEDPRLRLIFADGRRFVRDLGSHDLYDLVVVFSQAPTNAAGNRFFTRDFYALVRRHLGPSGVICTRVSAASNYLGREVGGYAGSIYHTLQTSFGRIGLVPGNPVTLCASAADGPVTEDPDLLAERYREVPLSPRTFPAEGFRSLLPARNVAYLRERLESVPVEIDTDARPVTYYLNTVLWGQLSASGLVDWMQRLRLLGPWPYLLPACLLVALWLLRAPLEGWRRPVRLRQGAGFALFVLGLAGMAAHLVLLLGVQAQLGFLFQRVALLNGLLMTGLALGAGIGGWIAARDRSFGGLVAVLLLVGGGVLLLPAALGALAGLDTLVQETGYLMLALGVGLLTGAGFPLGVALAHRELASTPGSAGLAQAADNFGGALGGLLTGALMVPLLGVGETSRVLCALTLIALLPLLQARLAPDSIPGLANRGFHSLPWPWPGFGWFSTFLVLLLFAWHWLERGTEPGPQVRFDDERLAVVAGPGPFQPIASPFPHYLGFGGEPPPAAEDRGRPSAESAGRGEPQTAAAASQAAAPDVRGFAGPLNLLVAVDREGLLRGVRYLDSRETPSYIAEMDRWLARLAGRDLTQGPLVLERIDAMSGATVTSRASLETINQTAAHLSQAAFGKATPVPSDQGHSGPLDAGFWMTLALILLALPVYLSGSERARLGLLFAALVILGIWLNTPVTEVDLTNLLQGQAATPAENPQRWLLWGFIALTALLSGQLWCGCLCPFGALQELVSRLGRRLGLRRYVDRRLDAGLRSIKFLLLAAMLVVVLATGEGTWVGFDPMQHLFGAQLVGWMWPLTLVVLVASLVYVRFWCRYLCPLGAFLALFNKVALLGHMGPRRRFERCDLGVRHQFDLDCIRCNRCVSGQDTRLHSTRGREASGWSAFSRSPSRNQQ